MKMHGMTVVAWFLLTSALSAQTVPPALMVKEGDVSKQLGLTSLRTEVRILGSVAETTTTMTFANTTPRALEGDLYFPLPEGATISGYALDVNGTMVDGVAVEKHEARRVFEEVVRRGIDPGLVQWTKGNNFQTRVFPIPANGSRTVRVQYVSELIGGQDAPAYHLPLAFKQAVPEFSLRVEVVKPAAAPVVAKGGPANFAFEKWRDSYVAQTEQRNWTPAENLVIALPKTDGPRLLVEKADDGQVYFAVEDYPVATGATASPAALPTPGRVVVFWDASGSRTSDHRRESALRRAYLARWPFPTTAMKSKNITSAGPDREHPSSIDLVLLRNVASPPKRFGFSKKGLDGLIAELENVQYDGGTQLGAMGPVAGVAGKSNQYLLFTDGISNFGREEPGKLDGPLDVFSAAATADHAFLRRLAIANGGRYFNLVNWTDADVLAQVGRPAWSFLSASIEGGDAGDLYPQLRQPLAGRFALVGKLVGESATVTASYGYGTPGESPQKQVFKVTSADAVEGSLLRRLWAEKKLAELMIDQKRNKKRIAELGKQFGLVTPYTSLLVLDSLEQYVEYEIAPPASLGAMRDEYMRQIDTLEHQRKKQKADKLAKVVRMWEQRVKWWSTRFKYREGFRYTEEEVKGMVSGRRGTRRHDGGMGGMGGMGGGSAAPAASPSSLLPAEARMRESEAEPALLTANSKSLGSDARQPGIAIKPWDPDTPYLKELRAAKHDSDRWAIYMSSRAKYGNSPAFFLDCADFFRELGDAELALQVLSNIAELELEDAAVLRVLGHRLVQIGQIDLAVQTFEAVLELRPEEPQSYRDLALALARRAEEAGDHGSPATDAVREDYARAMDLLAQVVLRPWDDRFPEIEIIALEEVNHMIPRAKAAGVADVPLDPRLVKLLDVDIRIVMTWHADQTDIDLWVTEPSGEKAYYGHNRTTIGGLVSCDFTGGYGPEEYLVHKAAAGTYKIEANYFGSRAARLLGPVTVQVDVLTNYGRANEKRKSLTLRLKEAKETVPIGQIEF